MPSLFEGEKATNINGVLPILPCVFANGSSHFSNTMLIALASPVLTASWSQFQTAQQMRHCNTTPLQFLIRSNANRSVRIPGLNASSQAKASKPHFSRTGFWTSNATSCEMLTAVVETPKPHCQKKQLYDISFLFCRLCWNQHCDPGKYFKKNLNILAHWSLRASRCSARSEKGNKNLWGDRTRETVETL